VRSMHALARDYSLEGGRRAFERFKKAT
jgi:hypothetical protein